MLKKAKSSCSWLACRKKKGERKKDKSNRSSWSTNSPSKRPIGSWTRQKEKESEVKSRGRFRKKRREKCTVRL
jgi:hypothetical protein